MTGPKIFYITLSFSRLQGHNHNRFNACIGCDHLAAEMTFIMIDQTWKLDAKCFHWWSSRNFEHGSRRSFKLKWKSVFNFCKGKASFNTEDVTADIISGQNKFVRASQIFYQKRPPYDQFPNQPDWVNNTRDFFRQVQRYRRLRCARIFSSLLGPANLTWLPVKRCKSNVLPAGWCFRDPPVTTATISGENIPGVHFSINLLVFGE